MLLLPHGRCCCCLGRHWKGWSSCSSSQLTTVAAAAAFLVLSVGLPAAAAGSTPPPPSADEDTGTAEEEWGNAGTCTSTTTRLLLTTTPLTHSGYSSWLNSAEWRLKLLASLLLLIAYAALPPPWMSSSVLPFLSAAVLSAAAASALTPQSQSQSVADLAHTCRRNSTTKKTKSSWIKQEGGRETVFNVSTLRLWPNMNIVPREPLSCRFFFSILCGHFRLLFFHSFVLLCLELLNNRPWQSSRVINNTTMGTTAKARETHPYEQSRGKKNEKKKKPLNITVSN